MLAAVVGCVIFAFGAGATPAAAQEEGLQGRLVHDDQPVSGVTITVFESGTEVGSAVSDADGRWFVPVPAGTYQVELDESTLPDGLSLRNREPREITLLAGEVRNVLFPLQGSAEGPAPGGQPPTTPSGQPSAPPGGDSAPGGQPSAAPGDQQQPDRLGEQPQTGDEAANEDTEVDVVAGRGGLGRFLALFYSGIHFGLYLALAALGLSLVFGTTGLVNFSHGELVTFGAAIAFFANVIAGLPVLVAGVIAVALGALFGWAQDRFFWSWLRKRGTGLIAMMIISIGVALMLRFLFLYLMGGRSRRYTEYVVQDTFSVGPLTLVPKTVVADVIAIVVLVGVSLVLLYTRWGKAIRAVSDSPTLAAASGINVDRVSRVVWAVGGALAALSGIILAIDQGVRYQMGLRVLLLVFAAVVLGGLGTAFGALVGSLIVGVFIQLSTLWIPGELKYTGALAILILVLLLRPQGILGRRERVG